MTIQKLEKCYFKMSNTFVDDSLSELSGNAVKIYILFRRMMNEKNGDVVWPGYKSIEEKTGIKSNTTISEAIDELIEEGWISGIDKRFSSSNHYHVNVVCDPDNYLFYEQRKAAKEKASKKIKEAKSKKAKAKLSEENKAKLSEENKEQVIVEESSEIPASLAWTLNHQREIEQAEMESDF